MQFVGLVVAVVAFAVFAFGALASTPRTKAGLMMGHNIAAAKKCRRGYIRSRRTGRCVRVRRGSY